MEHALRELQQWSIGALGSTDAVEHRCSAAQMQWSTSLCSAAHCSAVQHSAPKDGQQGSSGASGSTDAVQHRCSAAWMQCSTDAVQHNEVPCSTLPHRMNNTVLTMSGC